MNRQPVIAILDVGKTNKKLFLIDEGYNIVAEYAQQLAEVIDEDGFPCEDLPKLQQLLGDFLQQIIQLTDYEVKAVNVSAYGASFVYINAAGEPVFPLYNYLKPYNADLQQQFYNANGGEVAFSRSAASPVLGNLNSGMQLYRLKYEQPERFAQVQYALHLPQYLAYAISKVPVSEMTSIGCHTNLWNFDTQTYQQWVAHEGMLDKLPAIVPSDAVYTCQVQSHTLACGVGLHDSSAALIPYLACEQEPFVLLSTGTWCIALNSFNASPLTDDQLQHDCLCYLSYQGKPVKASRLFAGHFHEQEAKRIAAHFGEADDFYKHIKPDEYLLEALRQRITPATYEVLNNVSVAAFAHRELSLFATATEAYHQLMLDMVAQQVHALQFVLRGSEPVSKLFVDGGFSNNPLFMQLLAKAYPQVQVYASQVAQASAIGAALAIHTHWNTQPIPHNLLKLTHYDH